jgi:phage replication-related protein YjqB (UPF0714/DUF867 family)
MGIYRNYQQLILFEKEGIDFSIRSRNGLSGIAIIAPHGGFIEPGTMELADAIAGRVHSFYCFEGAKPSRNSDLHIASCYFDEPIGVDVATKSRIVLALHGCREIQEVVYLGGLNTYLGEKLQLSLLQSGFSVGPSTGVELAGKSPNNICNRCQSGQGIQIEVSRGLREIMFKDLIREGKKSVTDTFRRFVSAIAEVLKEE